MLTRRMLLGNTLVVSAGLTLSSTRFDLDEMGPLLTLRPAKAAPVSVPVNFIGLGYEMSSIAPLGLLSPANRRYVNLIRGLGPQGVLRAGGIVANFTRYEPNGTIRAEPQNTVITRASLEQFGAFLRETGWSAIWSVNFAQGSLADAVEEARAVAEVLGPRLLAIELGNEVEFYGHGNKLFRKPSYDYEAYRAEFNAWRAAIVKSVPGMHFAAPDTAASVEWVERMASDAKGNVQLLTTHYYRNGQQQGTAEQLLHPDPRLTDVLARLRTASQKSGIPWRMCETNSFSGGGRPGVSDALIGALWTLDYMLLLAGQGCSGVNMEMGVNQLGFISSYSPIQDDGKSLNTAGVPYYGMLAFASALAGCPEFLPIDIDSQGVNVTTYLLGAGGKPGSVVVVNRDRLQHARLSLTALGMGTLYALRLLAATPDSTTGVTFGGASVGSEGRWTAKSEERIRDGVVTVPRMSAVVLRSVHWPARASN
jgi:hypothetical protein